jgi:hypothetical protein
VEATLALDRQAWVVLTNADIILQLAGCLNAIHNPSVTLGFKFQLLPVTEGF